jgi:ABC-type transport system involved in multi-copper enzyme maturation permease subunit
MDTPAVAKPTRINRWLPYWAVFQADVGHTLRSWVYRFWVLTSLLATVGYLLYRFGIQRDAGINQPASNMISDLLRWTVFGSVTLIIVLTAGSISGERTNMADSVLCRGISRYQYFLGKWHARLATVLGTFLLMGLLALAGSFFLLEQDLRLMGGMVALLTVSALLAVVTTCGVAISAMTSSTMLGIAVLWMVLYGTGFLLALVPNLPREIPSPDRALNHLPNILRGYYDLHVLARLVGWSVATSCVVAAAGMVCFMRRDV